MQKLSKIVSISLCVAMGIYPVCGLIARIFGYDFRIFSEIAWFLLLLAGTGICFLLLRKSEQSFAWCGLLPIFALGNWICSMTHGLFPMILAVLMLFATIPILMRHTNVHWLKVTALGIAGLLCMPLLGLSLLGNLVSSTQNYEVVLHQPSPDGKYYAECLQNKQVSEDEEDKEDKEDKQEIAAIVKVYENSGFDIGICSASKLPQKVYTGDVILELAWKDNTCLLIDGKEYPIK